MSLRYTKETTRFSPFSFPQRFKCTLRPIRRQEVHPVIARPAHIFRFIDGPHVRPTASHTNRSRVGFAVLQRKPQRMRARKHQIAAVPPAFPTAAQINPVHLRHETREPAQRGMRKRNDVHARVRNHAGTMQRSRESFFQRSPLPHQRFGLNIKVVRVIPEHAQQIVDKHKLLWRILGTDIEPLQLEPRHARDHAGAIAGAVHAGIMNHHRLPIAAGANIAFQAMNGQLQGLLKRLRRIFRILPGIATVGNDMTASQHGVRELLGITKIQRPSLNTAGNARAVVRAIALWVFLQVLLMLVLSQIIFARRGLGQRSDLRGDFTIAVGL